MKTIYTPLIILIFFGVAGCTAMKKVQKNRKSEKLESVTDSKTETESRTLTDAGRQSLVITTIREKIDTSAHDPGSSIAAEKGLSELLRGNPIYAESDDQILNVFYDSLTKTIRAQATEKTDHVSMKFDRTTEKTELVNSQSRKDENIVQTEQKKDIERREAESETMNKEVKRNYWPLIIAGAAFLVILVIVVRVWGRKIFSKFLP